MNATVSFALKELNKYYNLITSDDGIVAHVKIVPDVFADSFEKFEEKFDDAYSIEIFDKKCKIEASNDRSVLLAVYGFLRAKGCLFTRPGPYGEILPRLKKEDFCGKISFSAKFRHRGVAIEGAVSRENVLEMIDYLPKNGYNSYFLQFDNAYEFFERWYSHKNNDTLPAESFDINAIYSDVVREIKKRGMILHSVGHGWTAKAAGCAVTGWDKHECENDNSLLALVNGEKKYYKNVPSNTNLCYSNPDALTAFAECVADYAEKHPETDVLHVWLADDCHNYCECDECRKLLPSDSYILALNKIDEVLTVRGIKTKIAFLAYCELLWAPEKYKIKNENRFILMFAPITRPFSQNISDEAEAAKNIKHEKFILNKSNFPGDLTRNLAFLSDWKKVFGGDSFIFDYPLMWEINKDISTLELSETIRLDIEGFKKIGINGEISCQLQRAFFPHGYAQTVMGLELFGEKTDDSFKNSFFKGLYGDFSEKCIEFFKKTAKLLPVEYFRYNIPEVCFSVAESAKNEETLALEFEKIVEIESKNTDNEIQKKNFGVLLSWLKYVEKLSSAIGEKAEGNDCSDKKDELLKYLKENELVIQRYCDVFYVTVTVASILSSYWDACIDEKCDEIPSGALGRQLSESFVSDDSASKLRYSFIAEGSLDVYVKRSDGSVLRRFYEDVDYEVDYKNGTIKRTKNSLLPDFSKSPFYGLDKFNQNDFKKWGNSDYIIYADYKYDSSKNESDALVAERFARDNGNYGVLSDYFKNRDLKDIKITVFGDSISTGAEANGQGNAYFYRLRKKIIEKFGKNVKIINKSVGGDSTIEGLNRFEEVFSNDDSDIVIVGFGMNDQNIFGDFMPVTIEKFKENLKFMGEQLLEKGKKLIFISPCEPNENWAYCSKKIGEYALAVKETAKELNAAFADVNSLWKNNLKNGKRCEDLLNNGINHPTDYGHYLYYLALKQLL